MTEIRAQRHKENKWAATAIRRYHPPFFTVAHSFRLCNVIFRGRKHQNRTSTCSLQYTHNLPSICTNSKAVLWYKQGSAPHSKINPNFLIGIGGVWVNCWVSQSKLKCTEEIQSNHIHSLKVKLQNWSNTFTTEVARKKAPQPYL